MSENQMTPPEDEKEEQEKTIQQDILLERKFTLAEAIGREGGCFIKGHNPVPILDQVIAEINLFIRNNLDDSSGMLATVLQNIVKHDTIRICSCMEKPLHYLHDLLKSYVDNNHLLYDLKREVDFKWGQTYKEKPYFQKPGELPHPEDEYPHALVKKLLSDLLKKTAENLS